MLLNYPKLLSIYYGEAKFASLLRVYMRESNRIMLEKSICEYCLK